MLEQNDRKKAMKALNSLGEETLRRIVRECIQKKGLGKHARYPPDLSTHIIDNKGDGLLSLKHAREIIVESIYDKSDKRRIYALLKALNKDIPASRTKGCLVDEASVKKWRSGGTMSRSFVSYFGFPEVFAGEKFRNPIYPNPEEILAWKKVPAMHTYQEDLVKDIGELMHSGVNKRCMFTLPTGAGKTRVVVEVLTDHIREIILKDEDGIFDKVILWIAHSEELCEQAIESMRWVWQTHGKGEEPLKVYRHWGSYEIEGDPYLSGIVIASVQKIDSTMKKNPAILTNLKDRLNMIVIDEAHRSTAPTYKRIINELGDDTRIIGLTATPFRVSDKETKKLVSLYKNKLIELSRKPNAFSWLCDNDYLSKDISKECIESGVTLEPNDQDMFFKEQFNEVSNRLLRELANDDERNEMIVNRIIDLVEKRKKVLLFACSVDHCDKIKNILMSQEIESAVITGKTGRGRRWKYIVDFKNGDLKVLINFGVLTTGFDDPKIDVIFIARPTMSSVLYGQMIGRGIRGIKNGGTGSCQIIDVIDNIINFDIQKSDTYLDSWSR